MFVFSLLLTSIAVPTLTSALQCYTSAKEVVDRFSKEKTYMAGGKWIETTGVTTCSDPREYCFYQRKKHRQSGWYYTYYRGCAIPAGKTCLILLLSLFGTKIARIIQMKNQDLAKLTQS